MFVCVCVCVRVFAVLSLGCAPNAPREMWDFCWGGCPFGVPIKDFYLGRKGCPYFVRV